MLKFYFGTLVNIQSYQTQLHLKSQGLDHQETFLNEKTLKSLHNKTRP